MKMINPLLINTVYEMCLVTLSKELYHVVVVAVSAAATAAATEAQQIVLGYDLRFSQQ
jgi:hypothetical protein